MGKRKRASSNVKSTSNPESKRRKTNSFSSQDVKIQSVKLSRTASMSVGTSKSQNAAALAEKLVRIFSKNKNTGEAKLMKKYMRDKFEFFGLKSPVRKTLAQECLKTKLAGPQEIRDLAKILWAKSQRELQYFMIDYLIKHFKVFGEESAEFKANMDCVKHLLTTKSWWDSVDMLSFNIVGGLVQKHPMLGKRVMENWINDDNMWLRRAAILHQLKYKKQTDEEMLFRFCSARAHEKEFFIQKSIGWALRSYAFTNDSAVKKFLSKHKRDLSKLSFKEAAKHLTGI